MIIIILLISALICTLTQWNIPICFNRTFLTDKLLLIPMWCRITAFLYWFTLLCCGIENSSSSTIYDAYLCCCIPISTLWTRDAAWILLTIIRLIFWTKLTYLTHIIPYWLISRTETLSNAWFSHNSSIRLLAITRVLIIHIRFPTNFDTLVNSLIIDQLLRAHACILPKTKVSTSRTIETLQSQWVNIRLSQWTTG